MTSRTTGTSSNMKEDVFAERSLANSNACLGSLMLGWEAPAFFRNCKRDLVCCTSLVQCLDVQRIQPKMEQPQTNEALPRSRTL